MLQKYIKLSNLSSIVIISVIAIVAVVSFSFFQNKREYNETVDQAKHDLSRLTEVASSNVEIAFISVDQILRRAVERQYFNQLFGKSLKSDMEHNLKMWVKEVPHISKMLITDENASVDISFRRHNSRFTKFTNVKTAIKQHVEIQKERNSDDIYISSLPSEENNQIIASRRLENIEGNFGGLVMAVIDGNHIVNLLQSALNKNKMQIAVTHNGNGGDFLVVSDQRTNLFKAVINDFAQDKAFASQVISKTINDRFRLFSQQNVKSVPVSVHLSINDSGIFEHINMVKRQYYLFATIFVMFIGLIVSFAYLFEKQVKKAQISENKALLASQAKSDFLAKMSHELRTPLNAIIGFSEMLSKDYFGKLTPQQSERMIDINSCGHHLLELINDVLDFSKGDAGKLTLKEETVDVGKTVNSSIRIIEQKARSNGINVINAVPQKDNFIFADRRKIKQIIINLLSNAIKFTPEGGKIIISSHYDKEKNFVISISDTGRGIDSKDIPKAMAVFEQVHGDDVDQGTGLGLPLCQMLTQMHGGTFKLDSKVGVGTTAYVTLPNYRVKPRI